MFALSLLLCKEHVLSNLKEIFDDEADIRYGAPDQGFYATTSGPPILAIVHVSDLVPRAFAKGPHAAFSLEDVETAILAKASDCSPVSDHDSTVTDV